jgi:DNA-binding GntR family transcriptional regulator
LSGPAAEAGEEPCGVYRLIREDILHGRLAANARLVVSALAHRYGTSTNPIREALQQLRGEGFVVMSPNRGARVRDIDEAFVRDTYEIEMLVEPYLTRWFVSSVTDGDIARLEHLQREMEKIDFSDLGQHRDLDTAFHRVLYDRHYNRRAFETWWKHRQILAAISRDLPVPLKRRKEVHHEHRELIACLKAQDADAAAMIVARHVEGAGRHVAEQMRIRRLRHRPGISA